MAITGGFGLMFDVTRGTSRRWYIGRDGVQRWLDNDEPVARHPFPEHPHSAPTADDTPPAPTGSNPRKP